MADTTSRDGAPTGDDQTLGALFANASRDLSTLVHHEIALARAELRLDVRNGAKGGAMFGAAGLLAVLAVILLSIAAAFGLVAAGLDPAVAFVVVAAAYVLVAVVLALVGKRAMARVGPPERTIRTSRDTAAFLKKPRSSHAQTQPKT